MRCDVMCSAVFDNALCNLTGMKFELFQDKHAVNEVSSRRGLSVVKRRKIDFTAINTIV